MIDPLSRVSVRIKLALLFVSLCLLAYGLGGSLVSRWTETALADEILEPGEGQVRALICVGGNPARLAFIGTA